MTRAVLYLRISQDPRETGLALDRQREECMKLIESRGWTLVKEYAETASAWGKKTRSKYAEMIEDVRGGQVDIIVIWDGDRLTRVPSEGEDIIKLNELYGVSLATVTGDIDLATDNGRLMFRVKVAFSRAEVERKSARQKAAIRQKIERGMPITGRKVIGWEVDGVTLIPEEAELIRETYDLVLSGATLTGTAKRWNDLGLRTSSTSSATAARSNGGGPWTAFAIRGLLTNPRYAGFRRDAEGNLFPGKWPAIVSEETWRAAVERISHPDRRTTPGPERRHLLSGLARCGVCGATMKAGASRAGIPGYRCSASAHLARKGGIIDEYIAERVIVRLTRRDAAELLSVRAAPDTDALRSELLGRRARRNGLAELVADGTMTPADVRTAKLRLDDEISELEAKLTDAGRADILGPIVGAEDVAAVWESLGIDRQRAIVDLLMTVTILPIGGGRHEKLKPQTIGIDWRV